MTQTIFITGVGSGIGHALAETYLGRGARVYGIGRREPADLAGAPGFAFASLDLSRTESIFPVVSRLIAGVAKLDAAILNAGVLGEIGDMSGTSLERMRYVMEVNLWANKPVLDALFDGNREVTQVAAISSGASVSGARGWNAYALSKAALNMMMKLYAEERPETHFSALAPGLVDTDMQARIRGLAPDARYPTVERLKRAAGTEAMPSPEALAPRLADAIQGLLRRKSGEFHDLRSLD